MVISALKQLPNLVDLTCSKIPVDIIGELSKLTQLVELTYWSNYNKQLKELMPFRVTFIGDPTEKEEDEIDEQ